MGGTMAIKWIGEAATREIRIDCKSRAAAETITRAIRDGAEGPPNRAIWIVDFDDITTNDDLL
jgi:hypothetical protein